MPNPIDRELILVRRYQHQVKSHHRARAHRTARELLDLLSPLLRKVAHKYNPNVARGGLHTEKDIYQLASYGALKAILSFDPQRSPHPNALSRHVFVRAENEIRRELYRSSTVHLSENDSRKRNKTPAPPKPSLISEQDLSDPDPDSHDDLMGLVQFKQSIQDGDPHTDPESQLIELEQHRALRIALATLNAPTRKLLEDIYGLAGEKPNPAHINTPEHAEALKELRELIEAEVTDHFQALFDSDLTN